MASITFDKKEFEKHIKFTPEIEEKIILFGTPIESVTENEITIEVFPNRPDLMSLQGFLRAIKSYIGKEPGLKKYTAHAPEKGYRVTIDNSLSNIRPYTACAIVKGLKFDDVKIKEIISMQEKLHLTLGRNRKKLAIGIYPLEKIALPIKFEARRPQDIKFIPLESDREMNGLQILQKHPAGREYAHLLEGQDKFPVFVDAKGRILSMPPIINSHETGKVSEQTKDIFIECSGFHFETLKKTLNMIVTTLADMGGKIYAMDLVYQKQKLVSPDLKPETIKISVENANKILGLNLKDSDIRKFLSRMGHDYTNSSVKVPAWRTDVLHEIDLIEDVAIAYGYNKFVPEIPKVATIGSESRSETLKRKIAETLIGLGFLEVSSYHLIKKQEADSLAKKIELLDSKTEYKFLRPNLLIPALRIFSENKDNEYPQKIFEQGTVFTQDKKQETETGITESEHLLIACSPSNFTELKQILNYLCDMLSIKYELKEAPIPATIDGRAASIVTNGTEIGFIGEMHPETLRPWGIKMPVAAIEISLENILQN